MEKPGTAGLGVASIACLARALRFPPSLEDFRSFCRGLGFDSLSSAEKVLISSVDWVAEGIECIPSYSSFLPIKVPNIARVWRRLGFTGGIGGAYNSAPFWREDPGGRFTVVTLDVEEMNLGSEISDLLIDLLRIVEILL
jgi:hypothetical protein